MREWTFPLPTTLVSGISSSNYEPFYVNSRFAESRIINGAVNIHNGFDLRARVPVTVVAMESGTVKYAGTASGMGKTVVVETSVIAPNGNKLIYRNLHLSQISSEIEEATVTTIRGGMVIGKTGSTGGVDPHFHFDVNAHGITTGAVNAYLQTNSAGVQTMGQNPAAFFTSISWVNKNPYGAEYSGYRE